MTITPKKPYRVILDSDTEFYDLESDNFGLCISCGADSYSCEPDAACYICPSCGEPKVFGTMHLLFNNRIVFSAPKDSNNVQSSEAL